MTEAGLLLTHALARACSDRAIDTLRLEKGYKVWGSDITADYTPYEAGLGFCVNLDSGGDFIGRDALAAAAEHGPRRRLATFTMDAEAPAGMVYGGEAILHEGVVVGVTSSGGFCPTVGKHVLLGYVPAEVSAATDGWGIEAYGEQLVATKQTPLNRSLYDPSRSKILA